MPRKPANRKGAGKPKKAYRRRRQIRRSKSGVPEWASLSVKRTLAGNSPSGNFTVNQLYSLMNTSLDQFDRAVAVSRAYQFYRIKNIKLTIKPTFDNAAAGGNASKMRIYYMLDKSGSIATNITLEGLKQMGARPRELDEKGVTISWAPSVLEDTMFVPPANSAPAKYLIHPWLSTKNVVISPGVFNPSNVDHLGVYWYCDQFLSPFATEYQIEVEVQFQFKKPLVDIPTSQVPAYAATFAQLDDSADGTTNTNVVVGQTS